MPTIYIRFLNNLASKNYLKSLTDVFSAATSMPEEIVRQWRQEYGLAIHESYGMTESASIVTFNHYYRHKVVPWALPPALQRSNLLTVRTKKWGSARPGRS